MKEFLGFTIRAPLASWGEEAIGEIRSTGDRPTRSAILGLLGAALGVRRDDAEGQAALANDYRVAVRVDASGRPAVDYHTAEVVPSALVRRHRPPTRASLLALGRSNHDYRTVLSSREYREDSWSRVLVWAVPSARWSLGEIAAALRTPVFTLFAGRKANVLPSPLGADVLTASTLHGAFAALDALEMNRATTAVDDEALEMIRKSRPMGTQSVQRRVEHDHCEDFPSGLSVLAVVERRDVPIHRGRWQFGTRQLQSAVMEIPVEGA